MLEGDRMVRTTLEDVLSQAGETPIVMSIDVASVTGVYAEIGTQKGTPTVGSIHINSPADAERFAKSIIARVIIALNGGLESLKIRHIQAGQFISLPKLDSGEQMSIDAETLFIYESSSHYEQIIRTGIDEAYRDIGGDWKTEVINDGI